jgi:hypothetical protein
MRPEEIRGTKGPHSVVAVNNHPLIIPGGEEWQTFREGAKRHPFISRYLANLEFFFFPAIDETGSLVFR